MHWEYTFTWVRISTHCLHLWVQINLLQCHYTPWCIGGHFTLTSISNLKIPNYTHINYCTKWQSIGTENLSRGIVIHALSLQCSHVPKWHHGTHDCHPSLKIKMKPLCIVLTVFSSLLIEVTASGLNHSFFCIQHRYPQGRRASPASGLKYHFQKYLFTHFTVQSLHLKWSSMGGMGGGEVLKITKAFRDHAAEFLYKVVEHWGDLQYP